MAELPTRVPRDGSQRPYRICVVCSGNICRSPLAEVLLREAFTEAGLADVVQIDSGGTTSWEVGSPADPRTLAVLRRNGHRDFGGPRHRARQVRAAWLSERDLVLAADQGHLRELQRLAADERQRDRVRLIRSFDPGASAARELDMVDPWYGGTTAFDRTYAEVQAAVPGIVDHVRRALGR